MTDEELISSGGVTTRAVGRWVARGMFTPP